MTAIQNTPHPSTTAGDPDLPVRRWTGWQPFLWKVFTRLSKEWISMEDRLGGYPYSRFLERAERQFWRKDQPGDEPSQPPLVGVLVFPEAGISQNPALEWTLQSLQSQSAASWEAWIDLPARPDEMSDDMRIHWVALHDDHSQVCIQSAFEGSPAAWWLLLGCGDQIHPGFLARSIAAIRQDPQTELLYWDEDQVGEETPDESAKPWFKPDWSPELLISANYLKHALVRRELLESVISAEIPSMDDLVFRLAENARSVRHIARVGVHCGCSLFPRQKNPSDDTRLPAVTAHLVRQGLRNAESRLDLRGQVRVIWPADAGLVSIVIPTRDRPIYLKRCLRSIFEKTVYTDYEVVLVDTGSQEAETLEYYQELSSEPRVRILYDREPFNYERVNNLGAGQARGAFFVFLNNDIEVEAADWLDELVRWGCLPGIGIVGGKLLYPGGTIQHAGIVIGMEGHASHVFSGMPDGATGPFGSTDWYRDVSAVTGACMAMRREVFGQIGGFDERLVIAFGDVEICQRAIRAGYRVLYTPFARLTHHEGKTRANFIPEGDIRVGFELLKDAVRIGDPYYNPNLSHSVRVPTLRRPWEEEPRARLQKIAAIAWHHRT